MIKKFSFILFFIMGCNFELSKSKTSPTYNVYFSPNGGAEAAIVKEIQSAKQSIYVQAYSFTSPSIAQALITAKNNGVAVAILLDKSDVNGKGSQYSQFISNNMNVLIDDKHAIAHNKVMIIDHKKVLTGSFNFTTAAEKSNAENSLHITDANLAKMYLDNWDIHKEHSH